jgi:predicted O-methyltransferase YrrM
VVDNVVRHGGLIDAQSDDPDIRGMREFLDALASDDRVRATGIQTVGRKGYDGFVLARVSEDRGG